MPLPEQLRAAAERFAASFDEPAPAAPRLSLAILTCMDARIDPLRLFGLEPGDAHVVRNAGALATDDALRSLAVSHWQLGTRETIVLGHTECGLSSVSNDDLRRRVREGGGDAAGVDFLPFSSLDEAVRGSVRRILASSLLPAGYRASGYVFDVWSGRVREVAG